jgi:hypothetical protein
VSAAAMTLELSMMQTGQVPSMKRAASSGKCLASKRAATTVSKEHADGMKCRDNEAVKPAKAAEMLSKRAGSRGVAATGARQSGHIASAEHCLIIGAHPDANLRESLVSWTVVRDRYPAHLRFSPKAEMFFRNIACHAVDADRGDRAQRRVPDGLVLQDRHAVTILI